MLKIKLQRFFEDLKHNDFGKLSRFFERFKRKKWENQRRQMSIHHEVHRFGMHFKDNLITLVISSFGLVAALSWNNAITAWLTSIMPENTVIYKFYTALFISIFSIMVTYFVSRFKSE